MLNNVEFSTYLTDYRVEPVKRRQTSVETLDGVQHVRHVATVLRGAVKLSSVPSAMAAQLQAAAKAPTAAAAFPGLSGVTVSDTVAVDSYTQRLRFVGTDGIMYWDIEFSFTGGAAGA